MITLELTCLHAIVGCHQVKTGHGNLKNGADANDAFSMLALSEDASKPRITESMPAEQHAPSRDGCSKRHGRERGGGGSLLIVRKKYPQTSLQGFLCLAMVR